MFIWRFWMQNYMKQAVAIAAVSTTMLVGVTDAKAASYTVKSGDTLGSIGTKYGVSYKKIMSDNGLTSTIIYPGQTLKINETSTSTITKRPAKTTTSNSQTYTVKSGDTLSAIASRYGTTYTKLMADNNLKSTVIYVGQKLNVSGKTSTTTTSTTQKEKTETASTSSTNTSTYTVKSGDTLGAIASRYQTTYQQLMTLNGLKSTTIYIGQTLKVSGKTTSTPVTQTGNKTSTSNTTSSNASAMSIAQQYLGVKYVYGGSTPSGFDCSGYVYYVLKQSGRSIGRTTAAGYYASATKVTNPQVGDLVFFKNTMSKSGITHIGFYVGGGKMISASSSGVSYADLTSGYWHDRLVGYGRL